MCTCISVIPEAIKKCIFDKESLKEMEKNSVISIGVARKQKNQVGVQTWIHLRSL